MTSAQVFGVSIARFYAPSERYNTGEGLSVDGLDRQDADDAFDNACRTHDHARYAIVMTCGDRIIREAGVSVGVANRSIQRAWAERYPRKAVA